MTALRSNLDFGDKLGSGFFGEVFQAVDPVHGDVAVKRLVQTTAESAAQWEARRNNLLKEGQRLSAATHKNVVHVHQLLESEDGDAVHLVMELCRGGPLQTAFESGPLLLSRVRDLMTQVALGLQVIHARGMIHRDIKPANILLDQLGIAKIGDFGLVTDQLIYGYASQQGYLDHLAIEVWGDEGTSVRSDVWAFGMTTYRLLHGIRWYSESVRPAEIIPRGGFARTLSWLPHIPDRWRRFVRKAMHDDRAARYQDASQLLTALGQLPVDPDWSCSVEKDCIKWDRTKAKRKFNAVWERVSGNTSRWSAWSEPLEMGNRRHLGGSRRPLGVQTTMSELGKFFNP